MSIENLHYAEELQSEGDTIEVPLKPTNYAKLSVTSEQMKDASYELGLIDLSWESRGEENHSKSYPTSYRGNNEKEKLLLWYAENFRRQYHFVYAERKPLLLAAENECGVQKMVCTALRPTKLPYPEFYTWQGCAKFVADHITCKPLDRTTSIPRTLNSPLTVVRTQEGHCFEYSTLLASYLIGSGYRAYVVFGYATLEVCSNDQTRIPCPLLIDEEQTEEEANEAEQPKYTIKQPKDLRSKFIMEMEARVLEKAEEEKRQALEEKKKIIQDLERAPPDPLFGCRVHSWVVVLPGKRDVEIPFFIEPTTGMDHDISSSSYLGLESIWDHQNYWVNLQPCSNGCRDLDFNLSDIGKWEHLLMCEPQEPTKKSAHRVEKDLGEENNLANKHLDMPFSWSMKPSIPYNDYERRFPGGTKTIHYYKSKLERFAPYFNSNGLVTKITVFDDYAYSNPLEVHEYFHNRMDYLVFKKLNVKNETVFEEFAEGRDDALKEHIHKLKGNSVEDYHEMTFYYKSRYDSLEKITLQAQELIEEFKDRADFLYYRKAIFGNRIKIQGISEDKKRGILSVIERFHRDPNQSPQECIQEFHISLTENKIKIVFQYESGKITAATQEFSISENGDDSPSSERMKRFSVDINLLSKKQLDLYNLRKELMDREERTLSHLRDIEDEMATLLKIRSSENENPKLKISSFDVERNLEAREGLKEKNLQKKQESERMVEVEVDYLAPYLAALGDPIAINKVEAMQIRDDCLNDFKKLLSERGNKIQQKLNSEKLNLSKKQKWYEEIEETLTVAEKEAYMEYVSKAKFSIYTSEKKLQRHTAQFNVRLKKLEDELKSDARLSSLHQ